MTPPAPGTYYAEWRKTPAADDPFVWVTELSSVWTGEGWLRPFWMSARWEVVGWKENPLKQDQ